jgi:hypothetical protein
MASMTESEEPAAGVPALASAEVAAKAMPKATDNAMRYFMVSSSRYAEMPH